MSELKPEIRKLLDLAKQVPDEGMDTAPFGFSTRVIARSRLTALRSIRRVQWAFSVSAWTAAIVILCCGLVLMQQDRGAQPASQIAAAAHFLAEAISP